MFDNESVRSNKPRPRAQPRHSGIQLFLAFFSSPPGLTPVGSCADGGHKTTNGDRRTKCEAGRHERRRGLGLTSLWSFLAALPFVPQFIGIISEHPLGRVIVWSLRDPKEMCWLDLGGCRGQREGCEWYYPAGLVHKIY